MTGTEDSKFHSVGTVTGEIEVEISFQIIGLFSEGLYSSPNKAIEELVSNAFDADAKTVHVGVSADRGAADASIIVADNGTGMDDEGLRTHWIVGDSQKAVDRSTPGGRRTIGKFGIGKLAAYVLGTRLTHFTKAGGKYYSTSMDFSRIPKTVNASGRRSASRDPVALELRTLRAAEARAALEPWFTADGGFEGLKLFGKESERTWTVAIISSLKPMATELSTNRLRWILSTAMPLRDDFTLRLNSEVIEPSKIDGLRVGRWILGKDISSFPRPGPQEVEVETDHSVADDQYTHFRVIDPVLGPVSGYLEVFESPIDAGKSTEIGRSHGFFVYVHGRLINPEDPGFGIDRNTLRHGTFSRFRVVVNIDRLDEELRSSRETLRDGPRLKQTRNLLQGLFNFARTQLEAYETDTSPERRAAQRFADSPLSLTERPILAMLLDAFEGAYRPRHVAPVDEATFEDSEALRSHVEARASESGIVAEIQFGDLGTGGPIAILDGVDGTLSINLEHPFVAHFADEFGDGRRNLPLQLFAMAEILLEAELHHAGVDLGQIDEVLDSRDELLKSLARSSGAVSSFSVANQLVDSVSDSKGLEEAVVLAFRQLGFEAIPKAGNGEPDGVAEAFLPGDGDDKNHYRVSLEAKSKKAAGAKVKKKDVQVSTVARHRDDEGCLHAIVVGPDFETGQDEMGAVIQEIDKDRDANQDEGKTITLMRVHDLARLVRLAPVKRLNLDDLRLLFQCRTPDEAAEWVDVAEMRDVEDAPFQHIVEQVWEIQQDDALHAVDYGSLRTALRINGRLDIADSELKTECRALSRMAPGMFVARDDRVELNISPDKVIPMVSDYVSNVSSENARGA
ncbi:MAG: ATP-binding protein [Actinomycetota bacterium]